MHLASDQVVQLSAGACSDLDRRVNASPGAPVVQRRLGAGQRQLEPGSDVLRIRRCPASSGSRAPKRPSTHGVANGTRRSAARTARSIPRRENGHVSPLADLCDVAQERAAVRDLTGAHQLQMRGPALSRPSQVGLQDLPNSSEDGTERIEHDRPGAIGHGRHVLDRRCERPSPWLPWRPDIFRPGGGGSLV